MNDSRSLSFAAPRGGCLRGGPAGGNMRFTKVLVANRGEIACRVIRTLKRLGIASVAIYSDADRDARHVALADEAVRVGAAGGQLPERRGDSRRRTRDGRASRASRLRLPVRARRFRRREAAGLRFIGPRGDQMRAFELKHTARELAAAQGVALLPGTGLLDDARTALAEADAIGYPVMLKSTAGGGGIGMSCVATPRSSKRRSIPSCGSAPRTSRMRACISRVRRARAAHRSADLRRRPWRCDRARRARLLGAAPQSESDRGNARTGPDR